MACSELPIVLLESYNEVTRDYCLRCEVRKSKTESTETCSSLRTYRFCHGIQIFHILFKQYVSQWTSEKCNSDFKCTKAISR